MSNAELEKVKEILEREANRIFERLETKYIDLVSKQDPRSVREDFIVYATRKLTIAASMSTSVIPFATCKLLTVWMNVVETRELYKNDKYMRVECGHIDCEQKTYDIARRLIFEASSKEDLIERFANLFVSHIIDDEPYNVDLAIIMANLTHIISFLEHAIQLLHNTTDKVRDEEQKHS